MSDTAISITLVGTPDLPSGPLQALYRITGRSTVELREAIRGGRPVYTASLFGPAHITVAPRLEKTIAYLTEAGLAFTLTEAVDGEDAPIDLATLREILEVPGTD
jgi:hypothetical protein